MAAAPPASPRPALTPVWLDRLASVGWRLLVTAALALLIGAIAVVLSSVTASILVSLLVSAMLVPAVEALRRRNVSRSVAAGVGVGVGTVAVVVVALLLIATIAPSVRDIVNAAVAGINQLSAQLSDLGAPAWMTDIVARVADSVRSLVSLNLASLGSTAVTLGTIAVLAFFLTFFLLQDGDKGWAWAMRLLAPWQAELVTAGGLAGLDEVIRYVWRTAVLALIDALVMYAVLSLLGIPYAGALASVVFLAGFVPYLGAAAVAIMLGLVSIAQAGTAAAVLVLAVLGLTAIVADRMLAGTMFGRRVVLNPAVAMLAIPAGAALFGVLGLVLGLPAAVFLLAFGPSAIAALGPEPGSRPASPAERRGWEVPTWLDRLAQWSWRGLVIAGAGSSLLLLIARVPLIVIAVVLAFVMGATILPIVRWLTRSGWSRSMAAGTAVVGTTVAVAAAFALSIAWTLRPMGDILDTAVTGAGDLDVTWLKDAVGEVAANLTINVRDFLGGLLGLSLALILWMLLTFFFLRDGPTAWRAFTGRAGKARHDRLEQTGQRALEVLSGYMAGTAAISAFGAVTSWLIMALLGLPLAVPIGVLSFFAGFIPYIGSFVATGLAFLVAVAVGSTTDVVIMAVYTVVFNLIQGSGVAPIVYGKALSLHPAVVLLAVPIGGAFGGILGMFLVVPIAAIISATWRLAIEIIEVDDTGSPRDAGDEPDPVAEPVSIASMEPTPGT
jgi:predicted PurR-regulated permease PerM